MPTAANRQPAVAVYVRREGDDRYRLLGLNVLEIEAGLLSGITSFGVQLLGAFGLPQTLPPTDEFPVDRGPSRGRQLSPPTKKVP